MIEAADLNLLTYVIVMEHHDVRCYYKSDSNQAHLDGLDTRVPCTDDLSKATIFNDPACAMKTCKEFNTDFYAGVLPISKKTFFMASLKGER